MSSPNDIEIRDWVASDKASLRDLLVQRSFPDSLFLSAEQRREKVLQTLSHHRDTLHEHPTLRCLIAQEQGRAVGYAVLQANQTDGVTGDEQTELLDFHAPTPRHFEPLIAAIRRRAVADGDSYLICNVFASQKREAMWLAREGFVLESRRNVKVVLPGEKAPEHPDYRLRRARQTETLFMMRLVGSHAPRYAPVGRRSDPEEISHRFLSLYSGLDVRDRKKVPLVLVHREEDYPVGYIILQPGKVEVPGGPLTLYLYDVAMAEEKTGAGLGLYLHRGGINLLGQMGGGLFYGDTASSNVLAQSAAETMGLIADSARWTLAL